MKNFIFKMNFKIDKYLFVLLCLLTMAYINADLHFRKALRKTGRLDGRNRSRIILVAEHVGEAELLG